MKLLILSLNYAPEEIGIGPYSAGVAEAFASAGHEVEVVCGKPYYPQWKVPDDYRGSGTISSLENGVRITRCAIYVPKIPTGKKRLLHHISFAAAAFGPMLRAARKMRPDAVLAVVPSMVAAPVARLVARVAGAKFWIHVQDFEIEAAQVTGLLPSTPIVKVPALFFEQNMLKSADLVSSISPAMCRKAKEKKVPPHSVVELRNWAEIDNIVPANRDTRYRSEWSLGDRKVAFYSGNIARKQGIEILIDAAHHLRGRDDILFLICGDGANFNELVLRAKGLENVLMKPLQPRERLPELLATADVFLLPQLAGAANLVLPSKLANMLSAGRPVIATADQGTDLFFEIGDAGTCTPPGDSRRFAEAIHLILDDTELHRRASIEARRIAIERWSRGSMLQRFVCAAEELASGEGALAENGSRAKSGA